MKNFLAAIAAWLLICSGASAQTAMVPCVTQTNSGGFSSCAPVTATNALPVTVYSNATAGFVLTSNGSGAATFQAGGGGGGTPALPYGSLQINNAGVFGPLVNSSVDSTDSLLGLGSVTPAATLTVQDTPGLLAPPTGFAVSLQPETLIGAPTDVATFIYGPNDPSGCNANENLGQGSIYVANGQTLNYTALAYVRYGSIEYTSPGSAGQCSMTDSQNDGTTNFTVSINWPGATRGDGSPVDGYILTGPFGSIDVGGSTSYTDDGTGQSASYQGFGGMTSSGQTFGFIPYNLAYGAGITSNYYSSVAGATVPLTEPLNNGSQFWVEHALTGNSGTGYQENLIYDSVANGYTTTTANPYYQTNGLSGGSNPYPSHYGFLANGSNLNQVFRAYSKQASPLLFSRVYQSVITTDPNNSQYYYFGISYATSGGGANVRLLQNINGAGYNTFLDLSSSPQNYTSIGPSFTSGSTVTPNATPEPAAIIQNEAATNSDPAALEVNTTNSDGSPGIALEVNGSMTSDWRWNPSDANVLFRSQDTGAFDFGQNNQIFNQFGSNFFTMNYGRQNYYQWSLLNADGSNFWYCETTNSFCRLGGNPTHGTSPLFSVVLPSGQDGILVQKTDTSNGPFYQAWTSGGNEVFSVSNLGYVATPELTNPGVGISIGSSSSEPLGFYGHTKTTQPNSVTISSAMVSLGLVASPNAASVGEGGTGLTSGASGGIPYFSSTTAMSSSSALTNHAIILGGGAGASPTVVSGLGTTAQVLIGNASGAPTWGSVALGTAVSGTLPVANGGTGTSSPAMTAGTGLSISGSFPAQAVASNAASFIYFAPGQQTSINTNKAAYTKVSHASTVDNITASAQQFTCTGNPVVTMYECGTSTTCASPTTIGSATVTAAGTAVAGTVSNSAITAGDYVAWAISSGTCTVIDISGSAQIHSN